MAERTVRQKRLKSGAGVMVVLVTCSGAEEGKRIAQAVVERRLAACVNVLSAPVHSVYRWKGNVENAEETLLLMKTRRAHLAALETAVRELHSYEVPEFIALPVAAGAKAYLGWLEQTLGKAEK